MSQANESVFDIFPDELIFTLTKYLLPRDYFNLVYTNIRIFTLLNHEKISQTIFKNAYPQLHIYLNTGLWTYNSIESKTFMSIMNDSECYPSLNDTLLDKIADKMLLHKRSLNFQKACVYILRRLWYHRFYSNQQKSEKQSGGVSSEKKIIECILCGLKYFKYDTFYIASAVCAIGNLSVIPSQVIKFFVKKHGIKRTFKLMSRHPKDDGVIYYSLFMLRNLALIDTKHMDKIRKYHKHLTYTLKTTDCPKHLRSIMHLLSIITHNYTIYSSKCLKIIIECSYNFIVKYSDNTDLIISILYVLENLCQYSSCSYDLLRKNINLEFISKLMTTRSCPNLYIQCISMLISLYNCFPMNKFPQTHISALRDILEITHQRLQQHSSCGKFHDFCINVIYVYLFNTESTLSNFIKHHPLLTTVKTYYTQHSVPNHIAIKWEHILSDLDPINFI